MAEALAKGSHAATEAIIPLAAALLPLQENKADSSRKTILEIYVQTPTQKREKGRGEDGAFEGVRVFDVGVWMEEEKGEGLNWEQAELKIKDGVLVVVMMT